jgi:hypothetical protein
MNGRRVHRSATLTMSVLMAAIGVVLVVRALVASGGGSVALLLVLGVLFLAAGCGRLYVERRRGRGT